MGKRADPIGEIHAHATTAAMLACLERIEKLFEGMNEQIGMMNESILGLTEVVADHEDFDGLKEGIGQILFAIFEAQRNQVQAVEHPEKSTIEQVISEFIEGFRARRGDD